MRIQKHLLQAAYRKYPLKVVQEKFRISECQLYGLLTVYNIPRRNRDGLRTPRIYKYKTRSGKARYKGYLGYRGQRIYIGSYKTIGEARSAWYAKYDALRTTEGPTNE